MIRLVTSFRYEPIPQGPTWKTRLAIASRTDRQRSKAARSPPTVTTQSRLATMLLVPLTGASRKATPRARAASSIRMASAGEIVLI